MNLSEEKLGEIKDLAEKLVDEWKTFCKAVKEAIDKIKEIFKNCISTLEVRKRYKFLKSIGIRRYEPYFQRKSVIRCRNSC